MRFHFEEDIEKNKKETCPQAAKCRTTVCACVLTIVQKPGAYLYCGCSFQAKTCPNLWGKSYINRSSPASLSKFPLT